MHLATFALAIMRPSARAAPPLCSTVSASQPGGFAGVRRDGLRSRGAVASHAVFCDANESHRRFSGPSLAWGCQFGHCRAQRLTQHTPKFRLLQMQLPEADTGEDEDGVAGNVKEPVVRMTRSEVMKARWGDPEWRAAILAKRSSPEVLRKRSERARLQWQDPVFREKQHCARVGRRAWNIGLSPSDVTRLRMSYARRGVKKSDVTRRRMSEAKLDRPDGDTWPLLISRSKKGKSRQYFALRREFRALHRDLKLWSDNYRAINGRLPRASTYAVEVIAPMLAVKIKRYLILKESGFTPEPSRPFRSSYEIIVADCACDAENGFPS
jgi:hypothetical protein